jgi:hypothetical protein
MIISTVLHTLKYVKILTPNEINDDLISLFKDYSSRIGFDICDDKTPPSEPTPKNQDIKSSPNNLHIPKDALEKSKKISNNNPSIL